VVLAFQLLEAFGLADAQAAVLLAPAVVGDLVDAEGLDDLRHLLALADEHLGLT